ncbi:MAG: DNA polymerase III subunit gamma and tau, partial [Bifidobacteriaceae bacterium]|nr:DNA polymerase III subunit gamma and tau [Bifidobacteriaceae bacterium]
MNQALYRRYRPDTFAEVIGQEHVTEPLAQALRSGRVSHAYLFSGPRGCGKTTCARILARCLNCAKGPTAEPCGECPSCRELGRGGGGSLDVEEIDAASHGGVDDTRDLREKAVYAPARDRYKVFILDEAHMVSREGFNALLKIVEEPPPHVKFVFATTEPNKVLATIRSRSHHYPFRLVPPGLLTTYMEDLAAREGIAVDPGVMPLVVRSGGGSVRDTESVLDQLIGGSQDGRITYESTAALLGFTPDALIGEMVAALRQRDGAAMFQVVESVVESGLEPSRFAEDLLERLRDLIVLAAAGPAGGQALGALPPEQVEALGAEAVGFGLPRLVQAADAVSSGLAGMAGATSPRLQLELLAARALVTGTASDSSSHLADAVLPAPAPPSGAPPRQAAPEPGPGLGGAAPSQAGAPSPQTGPSRRQDQRQAGSPRQTASPGGPGPSAGGQPPAVAPSLPTDPSRGQAQSNAGAWTTPGLSPAPPGRTCPSGPASPARPVGPPPPAGTGREPQRPFVDWDEPARPGPAGAAPPPARPPQPPGPGQGQGQAPAGPRQAGAGPTAPARPPQPPGSGQGQGEAAAGPPE